MDEMLVGLVLTDMGDGHETGEAALGASLPALPANATSQSEARGLTGLTAGPIVHKRIGRGRGQGRGKSWMSQTPFFLAQAPLCPWLC